MPKRIALAALVAVLAFAIFITSSAFSCISADTDRCNTQFGARVARAGKQNALLELYSAKHGAQLQKDLQQFVIAAHDPSNLPPSNTPPQTGNNDPTNSVVPQGTWTYISPKTKVWYRVNDSIRRLTVMVEANHEPGLEIAVYGPEQLNDKDSAPIGRATKGNGYDFWWSGTLHTKGSWRIRIENANDFSLPFKLQTKTMTDNGVEYIPSLINESTNQVTTPVHVAPSQPVSVAPPKPAAPPVAEPMPSGDSPFTARKPNGDWIFIQPGQTLWYSVRVLQRLNFWVDTGGQQGIDLAIYGPGTTDFNSKPVGRGSKNGNERHDLFWTGRVPDGGIWYARVTNHNQASLPISVNYAIVKSRIRDFCTSCHGNEFDFETCDSKDPKFCEEVLPGKLKQ